MNVKKFLEAAIELTFVGLGLSMLVLFSALGVMVWREVLA